MRIVLLFIFFLTLSLQAASPIQMDVNYDPLTRFITEMFQKQQKRTLCSAQSDSLQTIRTNMLSYLQFNGYSDKPSVQESAKALWTLYPCPFSPYRPELRLATSKEIEGTWVFPESSQKLRFGGNFMQKPLYGAMPITCDGVGYYPQGELRNAIFTGQSECPLKKGSDFDLARKNPLVSHWSLLNDGRISVTRTDIANHIEEWDMYIVTSPFSYDQVDFMTGDLVAYLRKENGNELEASTQFRHLRRLP